MLSMNDRAVANGRFIVIRKRWGDDKVENARGRLREAGHLESDDE